MWHSFAESIPPAGRGAGVRPPGLVGSGFLTAPALVGGEAPAPDWARPTSAHPPRLSDPEKRPGQSVQKGHGRSPVNRPEALSRSRLSVEAVPTRFPALTVRRVDHIRVMICAGFHGV